MKALRILLSMTLHKQFIIILFLAVIAASFYEAKAQPIFITNKYNLSFSFQNNELYPYPRLKGYGLWGEGYVWKNLGMFASLGNSNGVWDTTYFSSQYTLVDYRMGPCLKAGNVFEIGLGYRHLSFRSNEFIPTGQSDNTGVRDTINLAGFTFWQKLYPFKHVGFFCNGSYLKSKQAPIVGKTLAGEIILGSAIRFRNIALGAGYVFKGYGNDWIGYHHSGVSINTESILYKNFGLNGKYSTFSIHETNNENEPEKRSFDFSIALFYKK